MKKVVFLIFISLFSVQSYAYHVKGYIDEIVVRHQEGIVMLKLKSTGYEESLIGCESWYHNVGFEMSDDPEGALYSMLMMSKMSGTKVYLVLDNHCLPGKGVGEIKEGRIGID